MAFVTIATGVAGLSAYFLLKRGGGGGESALTLLKGFANVTVTLSSILCTGTGAGMVVVLAASSKAAVSEDEAAQRGVGIRVGVGIGIGVEKKLDVGMAKPVIQFVLFCLAAGETIVGLFVQADVIIDSSV